MNSETQLPPLGDDERVIWRGAPAQGVRLGVEAIALGIFALVITAAGAGMGFVLSAVGIAPVWLCALAGLALGGVIMAGFLAYDARLRARTHYLLTTHRAFVFEPLRGNRLPQDQFGWPIDAPDAVTLQPGQPGSVLFAKRPDLGQSKTRKHVPWTVGFKLIDDAEAVAAMLRQVAAENAARRDAVGLAPEAD